LSIGKRIDTAVKAVALGKQPDYKLLKPAERALVKGYAIRWQDYPLKIEKIDVAFKVRMGSAEVVGEMDSVGVRRGVQRTEIMETKTTSKDIGPGSDYWRQITNVDPQSTIYLFAAKELGIADPWLTWDVMRKPELRQKKDEADDDFESRVLEDISERFHYYYQRAQIVRSDEEHQAAVRDINGTLHLMQVTRMLPEAPRNVDACFTFHRPCDFLPVCSGSHSIEDPTLYKDKEKREHKPQITNVEIPAPPKAPEYVF
jgi:hypothetical protein